MNENLDDFFAHEVFEDGHGIDPLEMNGNDFFYDDLDDFLEMNEILDDFAQDAFGNDHEIDLFDDDPDDFFDQFDGPEDFLEMNENLDDFFASSDRNQMDSSDWYQNSLARNQMDS